MARMRHSGATACALLLLPPLLAFLAGGCRPKPLPPPPQVLNLPDLVERINRNNEKLPTLYARIRLFEGEFFDPGSNRSRFLNGDGDLFVLKPRHLLLRGRKDPVGEIFRLGSDDERFWMIATEGDEGMWWGHHRNAGKPCMKGMPIRPDLLGEVLGIGEVATDLRTPPFPTLRFNNDADAYMLTWTAPLPDRWFVEKEVWYDRRTLLPKLVLLFDRDGKIVLRAYLSDHVPVEVPGVERADWPSVATRYSLLFPETRSKMTIELAGVALKTRTGNPKPGMIRFPQDVDLPGSKVIQIDADCE